MSRVGLTFEGLEEFKAALRTLPTELREEGAGLVRDAATAAHAEIVSRYPRWTGNLQSHVRIDDQGGGSGGASVRVRSTAKHAFIFEHGSVARTNRRGANRGVMPAADIFVKVMVKHRRVMRERLAALMERKGLEVRRG